MITTLVRTVSWLAASASTLSVSVAAELADRARAVVATASCESCRRDHNFQVGSLVLNDAVRGPTWAR